MNERAIERDRIAALSVHEQTMIMLKAVHDAFSGHVGREEENKDCKDCLANKKAEL